MAGTGPILKAMNPKRAGSVLRLLAAFTALIPASLSAQLVLGQYQDEAPVGTWNTFPFLGAAALGRGGTAFSLASDASAAASNPALLIGLPKFMFHMNGSYHLAEFFKYGLVNTGVFKSEGNVGLGLAAVDFAGLAFRLAGWSLGLNIGQTELFYRPEASYEESFTGSTYRYVLLYTQKGWLRTLNFSLARRIGPKLSLGFGVNYVVGRLDRKILEQETPVGFTFLDTKAQDFSGYFIQGGLLFEMTEAIRIAAAVKAPYALKAKSASTVRFTYSAPYNTDIGLTSSSEDTAEQPLILGLGVNGRVLSELTLAIEATYFAWSKYLLNSFEERQIREFKDVVRLGAGAEYELRAQIFGVNARIPVRMGFIYDPQPMKDPRSAYACLTLGSGLHWRGLRLDIGALLGRESGSGNRLDVKRFAVALGFGL